MKKIISLVLTGAIAAAALTGCGNESNESDVKAASTQSSSDIVANEADSSASVEEASDLPQWKYGKFTASVVDGQIDLSGLGVVIEVPEELKDKADSIGIRGSVTDEFGYASIYWINPDDPDNTGYEIVDLEADVNPVNVEDLVYEDYGITTDVVADLGSNGGFNYYAYREDTWYEGDSSYFDENVLADLDEDRKAEYIEFLSYSSELIDNITFVDFLIPEALGADDFDNEALLNFELTDLDGNTVKSGDYISSNKVTMINFWGTFCGPCINEMPYLAEIEQEYKDQGFEIVGMTCDVYDSEGNYQEDIVLDALDIIEDTGVEYPILIASVELRTYAQLTAYPTTFFVDSEGRLLTSPIVGSHSKEEWEAYIEEALAAVN